MKLFVLLSHDLSEEQKKEAYENLHVKEILNPPLELRNLWASIPPQAESIRPYLSPIFKWLSEAKEGDYVLVQGDFGAVFLVADYAFRRALIPIYATTRRLHTEEKKGEQVRMVKIFHHARFRRYERWEKS